MKRDFINVFCSAGLQYEQMSPEELYTFSEACKSLGIENVPDDISEDEFNRLSRILFAMNDAMEESEELSSKENVLTEDEYIQALAERAIAEEAEIEAAAAAEVETNKNINIKGEDSQEEIKMTNTTNNSNVNVNKAAEEAVKFTEQIKDAAVNAGRRVYDCSQKVRDFFDEKANMSDEEFSNYVEGHIDYISDLIKDAISQRVKDIDEAKFDDDDEDSYDDKKDREAKETIFAILDRNQGGSKWKTFKEIVIHVAKWFFNIIKKIAMIALKIAGVLIIGTLKIACVSGSALFKAGSVLINEGIKPAIADTKEFNKDFKEYREAKKADDVKKVLTEDDFVEE